MQQLGHPCIYLVQVDSTNNYIANHARVHTMAEGTAILTYNQFAGKGQFENTWVMQSGEDIALTYLLRPELNHETAFRLNKAIALGIVSALKTLSQSEVHIKWPNDLFIKGRKVAGTLIETTWHGVKSKRVLVGIGLNVNGDTSSYPFSAISLSQIVKDKLDLAIVKDVLDKELSASYALFQSPESADIDRRYDALLLGSGQEVIVRDTHALRVAKLIGVDNVGRVKLEIEGEQLHEMHGQVQIDYSRVK